MSFDRVKCSPQLYDQRHLCETQLSSGEEMTSPLSALQKYPEGEYRQSSRDRHPMDEDVATPPTFFRENQLVAVVEELDKLEGEYNRSAKGSVVTRSA